MKTITLSNGKVTLVDDADFVRFGSFKWWFNRYVFRSIKIDGRFKTVYLHRLILDAPNGSEVDHKNMNPLDNRRKNLRYVTHSQNMQNFRRPRSDSTTGFRNVYREKQTGRYTVKIKLNGHSHHYGSFVFKNEAVEKSKIARRKFF